MKKTLKVKFTRDPRFTPTSLTVAQLSRAEWLARALFADSWYQGIEADKSYADMWLENRQLSDKVGAPLRNRLYNQMSDSQYKYVGICLRFLIACALRNGEIGNNSHSSSYYASRTQGYN
jgi:hypothetical protein